MSERRKRKAGQTGPVEQNETERPGGVTGKGFMPGQSGNPGGQSKEKRAFLERLKSEDADEIYAAFMKGVRDGVPPIVIRAVEYLAGKPKESVELTGKDGGPVITEAKQAVMISLMEAKKRLDGLESAGALEENAAPTKEQSE